MLKKMMITILKKIQREFTGMRIRDMSYVCEHGITCRELQVCRQCFKEITTGYEN